jgi:acyl-CoA synthetase (NDP forming)
MVPAAAVPGIVAQCCERKVPVATIFSAGFAELGAEGLDRQRDMVKTARAGGLRLLGPNCMGLVSVPDATPLTVNAVFDGAALTPGPLSMVSQSGSMLGTMLTRAQARGLGFSRLVSVGNECDLGVGEIAEMLADDPATGAILLFLETFRDAGRLARAARRAYDEGKPVIAYKLGRSGVGRQVAASHTGAMVGPDEVADAFFREHGILRVDMMESLFETPRLVRGRRPPRGRRVAVVTGTGGAAAMVVDRLGMAGVEVVPPTGAVIERLAAKGVAIAPVPLTDIPMGRSEGGVYGAILSELLVSDHCDAVVSVVGSSSRNTQVIVDRVLKATARDRKPLAVFLAPQADEALALLEENGIAGFRTPETCADAVSAYINWRAPAVRAEPAAGDTARAASLIAGTQAARLNERDSLALFSALGIAAAEGCVWTGAGVWTDPGGEVAIKILSADIAHKTDAGLVRLGVPAAVARREADGMLEDARRRFPAARIDGVLLQRMERGLAEVIVGYRRDAEVGPVVLLGAGGTAAELKRDPSVRLAPVSLEVAAAMIEEVRDLAILRGYRKVGEAEINPLIVRREGEGVVAVDGLVAFEEKA